MSIWNLNVTLDQINQSNKTNIHGSLGILFTTLGEDYLEGTMPVDERTKQPAGILHGGASVVLAESLGSVASLLVSGTFEKKCVGIEVNANHLKAMTTGTVWGKATPIRLGKSLHVWEIRIRESQDPASDLVCISRLTVLIKG